MIAFLTGPVRSGKSTWAQRFAERRGGAVTYIATARPDGTDAEFEARLARHRADRPPQWRTVESALPPRPELAALLAAGGAGVTIIDSLGTWLADLMWELEPGPDEDYGAAESALEARAEPFFAALDAWRCADGLLVVVSEETGWGLVPLTPVGRLFRDVLGRVNQRVATLADVAFLVVAGALVPLKRRGEDAGAGALEDLGEGGAGAVTDEDPGTGFPGPIGGS
jgi:adenosylcobinamide kinase/adenosylcobinamide-phosphate guanylyltransferase